MNEQHLEFNDDEIEMVIRHRARSESPWRRAVKRTGYFLVLSVVLTVAVSWFQATSLLRDGSVEEIPAPLSWLYGLVH